MNHDCVVRISETIYGLSQYPDNAQFLANPLMSTRNQAVVRIQTLRPIDQLMHLPTKIAYLKNNFFFSYTLRSII